MGVVWRSDGIAGWQQREIDARARCDSRATSRLPATNWAVCIWVILNACAGNAGCSSLSASNWTPREKYSLSTLQGKAVAGAFVGGDIVEGFLEGDAVEGGGAVGVEAVEDVGDAVLALGRLEIGVVLDAADYGDGGAGGVGADDEADAVGQGGIGNLDEVVRHLELIQLGLRPTRAARPAWWAPW